ncbi:hypothetical protein [Geochorda subterranea]|uniref:Uncharacterized protein n=1 Tax=Geochorda subterranea TaxID=3109564 RepID=A0ABZ1BNN0_9FIRM|nr:hypothetical protein [Limnochorda sp. LNt]WRP13732.1 hypothetical protein VLY81_09800 [Limnochorda sp. LNt]
MVSWWIIGTAAAVYLVARYVRVRGFHRELSQVITVYPDANGVYRYLADYHERAQRWRRAPLEAAAVTGITAYEAIYALSMIDPDVLEAAERIGGDFSSWAQVEAWQRSIEAMEPSAREGAIRQLVGYTGEMKVAAHLVADGHVVEFPEAPNQAGYDLLVDGSPLQVKTTIHPSLVREHLSTYPDIPVVIPQELHELAEAPGVVVDHDLSHADVTQSVRETLEGVGDLGGLAAHVPWITLAVSGFREVVLMARGWTDLATALKNVGIDVAGVGVGSTAGVKAGLALGFVLGGTVGAVIGAILGALGGSTLGKRPANWLKARRARAAAERFRRVVEETAEAYLEALAAHVDALRRRRQAIWRTARPWLARLLWPRRRDVATAYVARRLRVNERDAGRLYQSLQHLLRTSQDRAKAAAEVLLHFHERPVYSVRLAEAFRRLREARESLVVELRKLGRDVA